MTNERLRNCYNVLLFFSKQSMFYILSINIGTCRVSNSNYPDWYNCVYAAHLCNSKNELDYIINVIRRYMQ